MSKVCLLPTTLHFSDMCCDVVCVQAEVQAVNDTDALKANPMAVDAGALSVYVSELVPIRQSL